MNKNRKDEYLGKEFITNEGYKVKIIEYNSYTDVVVQFEDGHTQNAGMVSIKAGKIKNMYHPSIYGKGFFGIGDYPSSINKKETRAYKTWRNMIKRCYSEEYHNQKPTYIDCKVCDEWLNYQNFAKWYEENYYEIEGHEMALDKDILYKNNKIYSPDTSIFVPKFINCLFVKNNSRRGNLPVGVIDRTKKKKKNPYESMCGIEGNTKSLGYYETPEEAFNVYKEFKENYIKEVASNFKEKIPRKLYEAMINYKIEIND